MELSIKSLISKAGAELKLTIPPLSPVSTESASMVEGRAAYLRTSLPGVTAWYHVGLDGFYTRIQLSSHYHSIATADKYSAGLFSLETI